MTKPKLWTYLAAGSALAIALSSAALGANATASNREATTPAALGQSASANLPDHASSVAEAVLAALTGGSNPSTVASNSNATAEHATKANDDDKTNNEAKTNNEDKTKHGDKANNGEKSDNDDTDTDVSEGQETSPAATTSSKPGWGCGDDNHTHSGPPGRPGASMPPGCIKAKSH